MGNFDYEEYVQDLKECLEELQKTEVTAENQKHLAEEMRELSSLIVRAEGIQTHRFTGWNESFDIILLTNRNLAEYTQKELISLEPGAKTKLFGAGVRARVTNLKWVDTIRTYHELLFVIKGMENSPMDALQMAEKIVKSDLLCWLEKNTCRRSAIIFSVWREEQKAAGRKERICEEIVCPG